MSRDRVNSIAQLVRRLSKTLSLNRGSVTNFDSEELTEGGHRPHVRLPSATRERTSRSTERCWRSNAPLGSGDEQPAPLASADCFDITDTSDMEEEISDRPTVVEMGSNSDNSSVTPTSRKDSEETQVTKNPEEDPVFTYSGTPTSQIYDFSYPETPYQEIEALPPSSNRQSDSPPSSNSVDAGGSEISSSEETFEKADQNEIDVAGDLSEETYEERDAGVDDPYMKFSHDDGNNNDDAYFEAQSNHKQELFHESPQHYQVPMSTTPPAILVTSPSNHDITRKTPTRPPPPVAESAPPTVPPLPVGAGGEEEDAAHHSSGPARPPPPRPSPIHTASPSPTHTKKHKIFGISVGPLPSDPDPNFPFASHFEKKGIVPNPKKALRNIIGGEKRKQRLKRKEEAEVERIIKTAPKGTPKKEAESHSPSTKSYLSDWREFQARVEATVIDTTSRLESLKWSEKTVDSKKESSTDDWANFEAHKEPQVEEDWAEFASEEEDLEKHSGGEPSPADLSHTGQFDSQISNSVQDGDWAEFDNLRRGNQPTENFVVIAKSLNNSSTSGLEAVQNSNIDNWADFDTSTSASFRKAVTESACKSNWAEFSSNEVTQSSESPVTQTPVEEVNSSDLAAAEIEDTRGREEDLFSSSEKNLSQNPASSADKVDWFVGNHCATANSTAQQEAQSSSTDSEDTLDRQLVSSEQLPGSQTSLDRQSSTPSQIQYYGYDDPSSQITTELYQSSPDQCTLMEKSSLSSSLADCDDRSNSDGPGDMNSQTSEYDVSYGYGDVGFGKQPTSENSSLANSDVQHFVSNVINTAECELNEEATPDTMAFYGGGAKRQPRAIRQGTLTENNPFRAASRTENPENSGRELNAEQLAMEDEKTTLATVALFSRSVHGEDEEMVENVDEYEVGEVPETSTCQTFDPFQTIYPTSDGNSSSDTEKEGPGAKKPQISIKKIDVNDEKTDEEPVSCPLLPAPPKTEVPAYADDLSGGVMGNECAERGNLAGASLEHSTPAGWETFNADAPANDDKNTDHEELSKAFEVSWPNPPPPTQLVPDLPRQDTPDPDLEIPFNPPPPADHVWRLWIRFPEKKKKVKQMSKYTTDRSWKEIAITLSEDRGRCEVNLHEIDPKTQDYCKEPYRTLRMEPYMQLSRCKLQHYDKYGKLNIFKINHVSYRELLGMRPEKFSIRTFQNLMSHKPKQNVALDHIPVYTEILKFGSMDRTLMRSLMSVLEDSLMRIPAHKDEGLNYTHEEVCCYVVDEYMGKLSVGGVIEEQKARTRIFCSAFVNGGPHIVLGINDKWRFGREIVRRSDILPVLHDDWITVHKPEFHSCLEMDDYESDHLLKFYPLDGCKFELMRFRVSLRHNRELPMQLHCAYSIDNRKVSMRCELLVPGYFTATGRSGAVPCENVEIRIPVPDEWIYHFRVEKHHKMGSVHSTLRKPGRIKGLERITQMAQSLLPPSLLEASIGLAKYEHLFKAIVWRIPRVPEKNEASCRPHLLTCNLLLNAHDTVPAWDALVKDVHVEFTMPSSTVSGTTVRSVSVETTDNAEKFVKYTAKYCITKSIDYQLGHRKDKALKGILDIEKEESSSSSDSNGVDEYEGAGAIENSEKKTETDVPTVDDLLGEPLQEQTPTRPATTVKPNELVDIFG